MLFVLYFDCQMHAIAILSNDAVMQIKQFITITITITTTTTTTTILLLVPLVSAIITYLT